MYKAGSNDLQTTEGETSDTSSAREPLQSSLGVSTTGGSVPGVTSEC